jgi:hypothetical protein
MPGLTSFAHGGFAHGGEPVAFLNAAGFALVANRAIRFDMLERLEDELEKAVASGTGAEASLPRLVSLLGAGNDEGKHVLAALGWRMVAVADAPAVWRKSRPKRRPSRAEGPTPSSPFSALRDLAASK